MVFLIGSIGMAQYTLTGYDASAHMSEETHKASRARRVGMLWSVIVSVIAGFILLVAITFAIPSQTGVQGQFTYITTYIWQTSMGTHWAEVLLFIVVCAQFYCLIACITSGSRMLFAFSRDRAVPGHQAWRWVSRHRVPIWAAVASRRRRLPAASCRRGGTTSRATTSAPRSGRPASTSPSSSRSSSASGPARASSAAPGASDATTSGST